MKRYDALDAARYLAFCGMVLVNFRIAAQVPPGDDWASVLIDALEGRAAALFVVLAGIGIALSQASAGLILRRAVFLFVLGLLNMTIFDADILHFYALYFVVGAAFLSASTRSLWFGAAAITGAAILAAMLLNYDIGWNWGTLSYEGLWSWSGFWRNAIFNGWHPVLPWAAFLLIGMAIGRADLGSRCIQHRLITWGLGAAILALIPQHLVANAELAIYLGTESIPPGPFYVVAGTGTACLVIGLTLKLWPLVGRTALAPALTAPGRQALTLYVAHILLGMGALEEAELLNGSLNAPQIAAIALAFCAFASLYALLWQRWFRRGPLEALMRLLTQPRQTG